MTIPPRFEWQSAERRSRRDVLRWVVAGLVLLGVFALGVALGEALHDNPRNNGSVTFVRTLNPSIP